MPCGVVFGVKAIVLCRGIVAAALTRQNLILQVLDFLYLPKKKVAFEAVILYGESSRGKAGRKEKFRGTLKNENGG